MTYYYYHYYNCIVLPFPLAIVLYEIYKYISLFVYVIIASLEIIYCTNCNNEIDIYNWYTNALEINTYTLTHSPTQSISQTNTNPHQMMLIEQNRTEQNSIHMNAKEVEML